MITRFIQPKNGHETYGNNKVKYDKQTPEKPTIEDLKKITDTEIPEEVANIMLNQIEELCIIIIEQITNGSEI